MIRINPVLVLLFLSCVTANSAERFTRKGKTEEEGKRPVSHAISFAGIAVARCRELDLTVNQRRDLTERIRRLPFNREMDFKEAVDKQNEAVRRIVSQFLDEQVDSHGRVVAERAIRQFFFLQRRPDLAFDWAKESLTESERASLQALVSNQQFNEKLAAAVAKDKIKVIGELVPFSDGRDSVDIAKLAGEPFEFRGPLEEGANDLFFVPDVESVRILADPACQKELHVTLDQLKQIESTYKHYVKQGLISDSADFEDPLEDEREYTKEDRRKIRTVAIARCESILADHQKPRFRELIVQRYLTWHESLAPLYLQEYLGGAADNRFQAVADRVPGELLAVRRLRIMELVKEEVSKVVTIDLDQFLGKMTFTKYSQLDGPLKFDNSVARRLLDKTRTVNTRRGR